MKAALLIVLSLSALAFAGPAYNKNSNNQIEANKANQQQQQQQYMTGNDGGKQTQATETLKQWCYASQMSQPELTASFKKLVNIVKSSPEDQSTEAAVMSERICQGASWNSGAQRSSAGQSAKSNQGGQEQQQGGADAQAHELIKDVYMDALIACESHECIQQLVKIINSNNVDTIRASYYMTRIAVSEKDSIASDDNEVKQMAESFVSSQSSQSASEAVERQKLFAATALLGKSLGDKCGEHDQQSASGTLKQAAEQVAKAIVERYIKPVSSQEVQQYQQQSSQQQSSQTAKKIAKRNAALQALSNIPGCVLKDIAGIQETLTALAKNKQEQSTARQSALEALEQNDQAYKQLKEITFDQDEPTEVRVAAFRALMTTAYAGNKDEQTKQQMAAEIVDQTIKHCEDQRNQQQDDQFVLYAVSYLDNMRTSQQPEHKAIKESIGKNKQHYMQIQLLNKKFRQQLSDIGKSSRNYKLEQEFNQLNSGLVIEGDIVYESKHKQQQQAQILPKLVRVNMSMPVMGETVNVVEITLRQDQMDDELLGALKLAQGAKFNSESMSKVIGSFKSSVEQQQQQQQNQGSSEADLTIKVDGCTVVYLCMDDIKGSSSSSSSSSGHQRNTRSAYYSSSNIVDEIIEHLRRKPVSFNRGFNFNVNERLAKVLDVEANIIAGLRFESRASGQSSKDFEIAAHVEPRFAFEAIVGPAKMSNKKLLQRVSTKSALGLRLRYKSGELVDVQVNLPMNTMELFTVEAQMVEKSNGNSDSYTYLPESIYGPEDIYSPDEYYGSQWAGYGDEDDEQSSYSKYSSGASFKGARKMKRSIFDKQESSAKQAAKSVSKFMQFGKQAATFAHELETPAAVARATGLRAKLRVAVSPKDMSFLVQAVAQKYDPNMQGYRVQMQKNQRNSEQKQYIVTVSTPGSRTDRTMQMRVASQCNSQRTIVKAEIQSAKMSASAQCELVHDGRQYAVKAEIAETGRNGNKWRHRLEAGVQRNAQSSGRIATTYKPYVSVDSSDLKRPIQMQGIVAYQQAPKSVISYELKSSSSSDFVQGKIILDESSPAGYGNKRAQSIGRSMQSPIEIVLNNDLTLNFEMIGQLGKHAIKVHQMADWDAAKLAIGAELSASHKKANQEPSQVSASLKLDEEQQALTVQRKCPQQPRAEFRLTVAADNRTPKQHQFVAEYRYNGKRTGANLNSVLAYQHKIDYNQYSKNKAALGYTVELTASDAQINEKIAGRTQIDFEGKVKSVHTDIASRGKSAKVDVEYASPEQHQIEVSMQSERMSHRTSVRSSPRQYSVQSRTEMDNQMVGKAVLEVQKQQGEAQLVFEMPTENTHIAADLKLDSGKLSSVAIQTPRFASKAEFAFDASPSKRNKQQHLSRSSIFKSPFGTTSGLRFRGDLRDAINQEAYWIESAYNNANSGAKSYLRFDSPAYRTDLEYDPRDQSAKFGSFARAKRSANYNQLYSSQDSLLGQAIDAFYTGAGATDSLANKLNLANKLWMVRSIVSSPSSSSSAKGLKQKARSALFEYADRSAAHKHWLNWSPSDERVNFAYQRQPNSYYRSTKSPMRFAGNLGTGYTGNQRPSSLSMQSDYADFDFECQPFGGADVDTYAKLTALSRHPRSPFKKHESEIRYKKDQGYKAWMKHQDSQDKRHSWQAEADESAKKWARMSYDSDKYGKGQYEHRLGADAKQAGGKRSSHGSNNNNNNNDDDEDNSYTNKIYIQSQSPSNDWSHRSTLQWEQSNDKMRVRRSIGAANSRYSTMDYLKHTSARLNSQTLNNQAELYNIDFDYQPDSYARLNLKNQADQYGLNFDYQPDAFARLNVNMPNDYMHSSALEYEPAEGAYKFQSKLYNSRTSQPSYVLQASTKNSDAMFINQQHPMLESPITGTLGSLFKQPLKVDYTDKYGRIARVDYDQSPALSAAKLYAGLRPKRAAFYYKDGAADFEHQSSYDFYPEAMLGFKSSKRASGDFIVKAQTKYGPIQMEVDSDEDSVELKLKSPVFDAKLTGQTSSSTGAMRYNSAQLIKLTIDNSNKSAQLAKIVRNNPILRQFDSVQKLAKKIDQDRYQHQTEVLATGQGVYKLKSQTTKNQRPVMQVEGELNEQQDKAYLKMNGERAQGQLSVDMETGSANWSFDNKRTMQHQTRVTRMSNKYFGVESMTSYKQQPLYKLAAKVPVAVVNDPQHLFAKHRSGSRDEHTTTFEMTVYEPKPMQISGQYDCYKKEARVVFNDISSKKIQETIVKYDEQTETILVDARMSSPFSQIYNTKAKVNLPGLYEPNSCRGQSCQSEVIYSEKSGLYSAMYAPGDYISFNSPRGQQTVNLSYY